MTVEQEQLRQAMRNWTSGVTVVVSQQAEQPPAGVTASSFTSVSLDPPLILVCLFKDNNVAQGIMQRRAFTVNMLETAQANLSARFAGFDPDFPKDADRFVDLPVETLQTGVPILSNALTAFDCQVHEVHDGSTHHIFVARVVAVKTQKDAAPPLVYYNRGYHDLKPQE